MSSSWNLASALKKSTIETLKSAKVELDVDPSKNLGNLSGKISQLRSYSNTTRDALFDAIRIRISLRREFVSATEAYDTKLSRAISEDIDNDVVRKMRSADEREKYFRQGFMELFAARNQAQAHLDEWEEFIRLIYVVYNSLRYTKDDILSQISIIKNQILLGELEVSEQAGKASGLLEFMSVEGRTLLLGSAAESETSDLPDGEASFE